MIINMYSVLMLFVASLGLLLALLTVGTAIWTARRIRAGRDPQQVSAAERSLHLARLTAMVCMVMLLLGWPLFYAMLASFVAEVPGAMCMFGVTKVMPTTTWLIQLGAPLAVFVFGAWLLLDFARRRSGEAVRGVRSMVMLAVITGLVAATSGTEIYYVTHMKSLNKVSCCSSFAEQARARLEAPAYYLPWDVPAEARRWCLGSAFFAGAAVLVLWLMAKPIPGDGFRRRWFVAENLLLGLASFGFAATGLITFAELLASRLMQLPFHNCLYCLITNGRVPDAPLILANLMLGSFLAAWTGVLGIAWKRGMPIPDRWLGRMRIAAATMLSTGVLMVLVHLGVQAG